MEAALTGLKIGPVVRRNSPSGVRVENRPCVFGRLANNSVQPLYKKVNAIPHY